MDEYTPPAGPRDVMSGAVEKRKSRGDLPFTSQATAATHQVVDAVAADLTRTAEALARSDGLDIVSAKHVSLAARKIGADVKPAWGDVLLAIGGLALGAVGNSWQSQPTSLWLAVASIASAAIFLAGILMKFRWR